MVFSSMLRILLATIVLFFLCALTSAFSLIEIPVHFLIGWAFHAWQHLPRLLPQWSGLLLPAACILIAGFMTHRFIRWWIHTKALAIRWQPAQTITSIALLLLASGAAIAMSGITHQFAWLMSEPWTENRGKRVELTDAVNKARQLMLALTEYETNHGHLTESLQQLRNGQDFSERLFWVKPGRNDPPEPFVLLHAGKALPLQPDQPVIISPAIGSDERFVVGFSDCSARSVTRPMLERMLSERHSLTNPSTPARHD
jgi:hypothetical protein